MFEMVAAIGIRIITSGVIGRIRNSRFIGAAPNRSSGTVLNEN